MQQNLFYSSEKMEKKNYKLNVFNWQNISRNARGLSSILGQELAL